MAPSLLLRGQWFGSHARSRKEDVLARSRAHRRHECDLTDAYSRIVVPPRLRSDLCNLAEAQRSFVADAPALQARSRHACRPPPPASAPADTVRAPRQLSDWLQVSNRRRLSKYMTSSETERLDPGGRHSAGLSME